MEKKNLLVSTSGGRTSALMAYLLWRRYQEQYNMLFVFANTSREKEETLIFVKALQDNFGIPIVWVEALVNPEKGIGTKHTITSFEKAYRDGEIYEAIIAKYGIPSVNAPNCTRELKGKTMKSLADEVFGAGNYLKVLGMRRDEPKRVNLIIAEKNRIWFPLWEWGITKKDVTQFWKNQSFDLGLQDHQGNCKLCFKKSKRKIMKQVTENPESAEWVRKMEKDYGHVAPEKYKGDFPLRFYRGAESIDDIIAQIPEASTQIEFDFDLDEQESCAESCEPFNDEE